MIKKLLIVLILTISLISKLYLYVENLEGAERLENEPNWLSKLIDNDNPFYFKNCGCEKTDCSKIFQINLALWKDHQGTIIVYKYNKEEKQFKEAEKAASDNICESFDYEDYYKLYIFSSNNDIDIDIECNYLKIVNRNDYSEKFLSNQIKNIRLKYFSELYDKVHQVSFFSKKDGNAYIQYKETGVSRAQPPNNPWDIHCLVGKNEETYVDNYKEHQNDWDSPLFFMTNINNSDIEYSQIFCDNENCNYYAPSTNIANLIWKKEGNQIIPISQYKKSKFEKVILYKKLDNELYDIINMFKQAKPKKSTSKFYDILCADDESCKQFSQNSIKEFEALKIIKNRNGYFVSSSNGNILLLSEKHLLEKSSNNWIFNTTIIDPSNINSQYNIANKKKITLKKSKILGEFR